MPLLVVLLLIQTFIPHKPICPFSFLECPYILFSFAGFPAPISRWIHYIYSKKKPYYWLQKQIQFGLENINKVVFTLFFIFRRIFFSDFSSFLERGNLCGTG